MGCHQRADREAAQSVADRKGRFGGTFPTRERQRIRSALALGIQVDPANLVGQKINELDEFVRIAAEQADLLAVIGLSDVVLEFLLVLVDTNRHDRSELFFGVKFHAGTNGIHHGGKVKGLTRGSSGIHDEGALFCRIIDKSLHGHSLT